MIKGLKFSLTFQVFLILFSSLLISRPSSAAFNKAEKIVRKVLVRQARKQLPASFFRHAKWAEAVNENGDDLPKVEAPMTDEEFFQKFPQIDEQRAIDIYYIIGITQMILKNHNIKSLPIGGTLLGLLRNGGQLPHDDDADFGLEYHDFKKVKNLEDEFNQYNLHFRSAFGISLQVYPKGGKNTFQLASTAVWNLMPVLKLPKKDLTNRGFIDLMSIRHHKKDNVYRYNGLLSEQFWWQQTIPTNFFESEYELYQYGPVSMYAPSREQAEQEILKVYPNSLEYAMRTVDHRQNQTDANYVLVPLTPNQKAPYALSEEGLQELKNRFNQVGLELVNGWPVPKNPVPKNLISER